MGEEKEMSEKEDLVIELLHKEIETKVEEIKSQKEYQAVLSRETSAVKLKTWHLIMASIVLPLEAIALFIVIWILL